MRIERRSGAAIPLCRRARHRLAALRVGSRRRGPGMAREVGPRSPHRGLRHAAGLGARLLRRADAISSPSGRSTARSDLRRAKDCIDEQHRFTDARFELSEPGVVKHFDAHGWAWHDNPFVGTHELNGLKILMMLVSNWDNKDVRDVARGSNTAIFEYRLRSARARGPLPDHRLGRRARRLGQQRPAARALGSGGVRRPERAVRHRRRRRHRAVRLPGAAHRRTSPRTSRSTTCAGSCASRSPDRRSPARRLARQRREQ